MEAAKTLGMDEEALASNMSGRGERKAFGFLNEGLFRPLTISRGVQELFEINAERLGLRNPFEQAEDVIDNIRDILEYVPLSSDYFPDILNPFKNLPEPNLGPVGNIPQNVANATGFVGQQNVSIPYPQLQTEDQKIDRINKVFNDL